jgi:tetratricopeptide (TPR) repeat protein
MDKLQRLLDKGDRAFKGGYYETALRSYRELRTELRDVSLTYWKVGYVLIEARRYKEALEEFRSALALESNCIPALSGRGLCYLHMGRYQNAEVVLSRLLRLRKTSYYLIYLGLSLLGQGKFQQAKRIYKRVISEEPTNIEALYGLSQACDGLNQKAKARQYAEKALELNPNYELARKQLSKLRKTRPKK